MELSKQKPFSGGPGGLTPGKHLSNVKLLENSACALHRENTYLGQAVTCCGEEALRVAKAAFRRSWAYVQMHYGGMTFARSSERGDSSSQDIRAA
ncbi:hypothetical protein P7K49_035370 [Saguinus oedipus]|uniref:Uncharacterized protein n=1 Tax=Saguinus oedipus TaxID=9490 RepID=A0ABQ9TN58_SAGOE|nr:hypothetical protein P7K49_035370 [Saguinus oedipus]